ARARNDGTSMANVTNVALKKLRGGWGNGGSAGHRKTERSDRQSNNKLKGMRPRGRRHPLWCFSRPTLLALDPTKLVLLNRISPNKRLSLSKTPRTLSSARLPYRPRRW